MKYNFQLPLILFLIFSLFSCKKQNNPPIISNQTFEITENSPEGSVVGKIVASDPDGDFLTLEITSTEDIPFDIDPDTGNLIVKKGMKIDYEAKSKYIFMVKVTDADKSPLFNFATITINIKDVVEIPLEGMVAYYPFNSNATDESSNAYDGIVLGPILATNRHDSLNSAYSFDGIDDYINLSSLVGNGIRSISLWFRLDMNIDNNLLNPVTLITREGDYNNYSEFSLAFVPSNQGWAGTGGKLRFFYSVNKDWYYFIQSNNSSWQKDKWYHVAVIIDPLEGMKMYIENVKQENTYPFYSAIGISDLNTYIGSWATVPNRFFKGKIDDVILYNRALTAAEVSDINRQ
jgi:hypothetical protein